MSALETTSRLRIAAQEALLILVASVILGFAYSFVTKKGIFLPLLSSAHTSNTAPPVFISFEEAAELHKSGDALFVDARHEHDYSLGHLSRAINVPLQDFELSKSPLASVPKEKLIVTYCDGAECNSSIDLAKKLSDAGFTKVRMFFGGWNEWRSHEMETEKAAP